MCLKNYVLEYYYFNYFRIVGVTTILFVHQILIDEDMETIL